MSATKHTPRPWFYTRSAMDTRWIIDCDPGKAIAATGGYEPNNEANARLIAAAPDLLEVATMVDAWGHGLRHHTAHEAKMVKAARAGIAKAEGRS